MAKPPVKPIDFVMPVGNDVTSAIASKRPFRQPCNFDGLAATTARGIEFLMDDNEPAARLFAFMDGTLHFVPAKVPNEAALALDFEVTQVERVREVLFRRTIEAAPMRALYEHFDVNLTKAKLETLLTTAGHRSRTGMMIPDGEEKPVKVGDFVDKKGATEVVAKFLEGKLDIPILVKAGDVFGVADTSPADNKRRLIWSTLDLGQQHINPAFYLQQFLDLRSSGVTNVLRSPQVVETLLATLDKRPRIEADVVDNSGSTFKQIPFSFGPHAEYHGFPLEGGVGLPTTSTSEPVTHSKALQDRRFAPPNTPNVVVGQFQARKVDTNEDVAFYKDAQTLQKRFTKAKSAIVQLWNRSLVPPEVPASIPGGEVKVSAVVNAICELLVIPAEIFLTILGHESGGKRLAYRIEPLKDDARNRLRAEHPDGTLELHYDKSSGWAGSITSVDRIAPQSALGAPPFENDGRPQSKVHVTLTEPINPALNEKNKGNLTKAAGKKTKPSKKKKDKPNIRRHFLIADNSKGYRPLIRDIKLANPVSRTEFDMTIDDEQFYCNRGAVDAGDHFLVCVELPAKGAATETRNDVHYDPTDSCQAKDGSTDLTDQVQYTLPRAGTLRALYIEASAPSADVTVTVKINGAASDKLTQTLKANQPRAAKVDGSEAVDVNAGDKISLFVHSSAPYTGLRVRLHLAPKQSTSIYILTGIGGADINPYPVTGIVDPNGRVFGPNDTSNTTHPLTFGDLKEVIETTQGPSISPGVAQTLIATARQTLSELEKMIPEVYTELGHVGVTQRPPQNADEFKSYFIDDSQSGAAKFGWLMKTPNALLVGAAFIRFAYLGNKTLPTLYDIPVVCAAYNQGSATFQGEKGKPKVPAKTTWGVVNKSATYVPDSAVVFNAIVSLFEGDPTANPPVVPLNPLPRLRFRS